VSRLKLNQTKSKYVLLSLIVILGATLRIYGLDRSLWLDEVTSVNRQRDLQSHLSRIYEPMNLYLIILHFFMLFGNDELPARLPSVIFGVLSILLIYKVGELFFGRSREGLIGAFLLSISTMHVQHSQEARYYSLCTFLSLLSLFLFYKAIKENGKKLWVGFILSTILAVLSHWYMLFVPLIEMLFLAFILIKNRSSFIMSARKIGKKKIFLLILGLIIISIFSLPILQEALYYIEREWRAHHQPYGLKPASFFQDLFSFFSFGFSSSFLSYLYGRVIDASFLYIFLLFFLLGLFTSIGEHREQTILLLLWVFLPAITVFILSFIFEPFAIARYLIFILPGYLVSISKGISSIANSLLKFYYKIMYGFSSIPLLKRKQAVISSTIAMVAMVAFAGVSVVPLQEHYKSPSDYEDWKAAAEYLEIHSRPGDVIIVEPDFLKQCLLYYYEKNSSTADFMKNITIPIGYSLKDFEDTVSKHGGVWLVLSPRHVRHVNPEILNWAQLNCIEARSFTGVSIYSHARGGLILVSTQNMSFIGLDSPPGKPVAEFWHNNDSAIFNVNISKAANYTIAIHAKSWIESALELVIDGASKGIKTFVEHDWSYVGLGTFYLDTGLHEIKIISREGGDLGDTNVSFDQVAIWPEQLKVPIA